jgi:membrane-bound lytic murein transglycosylase A
MSSSWFRRSHMAPRAGASVILGAALAALLAGCAGGTGQPAGVEERAVSPRPAAPAAAPSPPSAVATPPALGRGPARWVQASYADLPGWDADSVRDTLSAFARSCEKPAPAFAGFCGELKRAPVADDGFLREWLMQRLQPYRVEASDGAAEGLLTGYFEPLVTASRQPRGAFRVALHAPPADLAARKPYWTRQQLDTLPQAQSALRGRELAWLSDPLDLLVLQIQGSGRLRFDDGSGREQTVRVAYAGHNDQPYKSVGRWLIEQGELKVEQASWPGIRDWARRNPQRVNELLWSNPRVVFFREEALPDLQLGPKGAQGVPLTPGRSIAVDPQSVPYGTPVWLDSTEPLSATPLRRRVVAQDTGSAITGAVRADFFWGWGPEAEQQAGRMKQPLKLWVLWPRAAVARAD